MESSSRSGWVKKIAIIGPEEHLHPEIIKYARDCTGRLSRRTGARIYSTQAGGIDFIIILIDPNNPVVRTNVLTARAHLDGVGRILYLTDEGDVRKIVGDSIAQLEPVAIEDLGTALGLPKKERSLVGKLFFR